MKIFALIDLSTAQATRILEQAVRTRAALELEPRPMAAQGRTVRGVIDGRENALLRVKLEAPPELPEGSLIGAFCEAQLPLAGELYQFTSCVIDVAHVGPNHLLIAVPQSIQLVNRRRFVRRAPADAVVVQVWPAGAEVAYSCALADLDPNGLAISGHRGDLDEVLLIGDDVRLAFDLPLIDETFEVYCTVCNKTLDPERQNMIIGLEFSTQAGPEQNAIVERLRLLLNDPSVGFVDQEDEK